MNHLKRPIGPRWNRGSKELKNIFLSASIPHQTRNPKYFDTADIPAIREAVTALALSVIPKYRLVWGGHPDINLLIGHAAQFHDLTVKNHVTLFQSQFFERFYTSSGNQFPDVVQTEAGENRGASLQRMRDTMFDSCDFAAGVAGVFIGGMEGVEEEYRLFRAKHPDAAVILLATTGAAAKIIYRSVESTEKNIHFETGYAYTSVFQKYLPQ
jgi:hypothetical protein